MRSGVACVRGSILINNHMKMNKNSISSKVTQALYSRSKSEYWKLVTSIGAVIDEGNLSDLLLLVESNHANSKALYGDILSRAVSLDDGLKSKAFIHVTQMLSDESIDVITSALFATRNAAQPPSYKKEFLQLSESDSVKVRRACASVAPYYVMPDVEGSTADEDILSAALKLGRDEDEEVRNWATFAFANGIDNDSPGIRGHLKQQLEDSFQDVRQEAAVALALRKDRSVYDLIQKELSNKGPAPLWIDAAGNTRDEMFLPRLRELRSLHANDNDLSYIYSIDDAIENISYNH